MQINLTAIIKSLPEKADEMKAVLLELVAGSTKEAACIQYDLHQVAETPNIFIFHEYGRMRKVLNNIIKRRMYSNSLNLPDLY